MWELTEYTQGCPGTPSVAALGVPGNPSGKRLAPGMRQDGESTSCFSMFMSIFVACLPHVYHVFGPAAGNAHGLPNNQPYASGHPQPYVSNAQHGGEEKIEEDMPVAIGVPLEK